MSCPGTALNLCRVIESNRIPSMALTYKEQLDALNIAYDLISQANQIVLKNDMGTFSYDEHGGHTRSFTYGIGEVRQRIVDAMNSINGAGNLITDYVNK